MNVKVNFAGLKTYSGLQIKGREFIENPERGTVKLTGKDNLNFLEIITTYNSGDDDRVEYFCHSNSGCRLITEQRAMEILKQWRRA